jgi:hypothetical protein
VSGKVSQLWRGVGRVADTVRQAIRVRDIKTLLARREEICTIAKGKLLDFLSTPEADQFIAAAGAVAGKLRVGRALFTGAGGSRLLVVTIVMPLLAATFRDVFLILKMFQLFLPATAGVTGAPLWRAAADLAVADTFPGDGVGNMGRKHGQRRQGAQGDQQVNPRENQSRYVPGGNFQAVS